MLNDDPTTETGSGLPSYSGSVRTGGTVITARAAYRRVSQVIALHWRAIVIIMIILVDVFFLAAVFIKSDNAESKDLSDITVAGPWLFCLVVSGGDKDACLPEVSSLVVSEAIVMSVLYLLSFNGYWAVLLFGRWSMFPAWITFIRQSVTHSNEFVSRDARRLSDPRNYEMLTSPPQVYRPKSDDVDMKDTKIDAGVNRLYSPTSKNKEFYGSEAAYHSPTQSFSRPRPSSKSISQSVRPSPSMGQTSHNIGHDHIGFTFPSSSQSPRSPPLTRRASSPDRFNSNQSLDRIGSPLTLQRTSSRNGSVLSNYRTPEPHDSIGRDWGWNPTTTYAQPSVSPQPSGRSPTQGTGREWDPRATHARGTGDQQ
ncbi:MAG: hypothetical protein MMC33_002461 [Icmadophila ericetorum]|nr:hypothetical protein [Icmadophila ericetorum]